MNIGDNCLIGSLKFKNRDKPFPLLAHLCEYDDGYIIVLKAVEEDPQSSKK